MPLHATPYPHVMNSINSSTAPKYTYLIFYSDVVDGQMWCPDCRAVESTVREAFDAVEKPKAIIYWVGTRDQWKGNPQHEARVHWKVQGVPTILRLEEGKETARLVEDEILDAERFRDFVK